MELTQTIFLVISSIKAFHVQTTSPPPTPTPVLQEEIPKTPTFRQDRELTFFVQIKSCKNTENTQLTSSDACKICGGTLLNKDFVLTAAHCLYDSNYAKIFFGKNKHQSKNEQLSKNQNEVIFIDSSEYIIHDNYNDLTLENDIALLPVFGYSLNVEKISLSGRFPDADEELVIAGWKKNYVEKETFFLETMVVPMLSEDDCVDELSKINPKTEFCASLKQNAESGCLGESGSPLFEKINDEMILYGMVSFSSGKCNDKISQAAVFTNIFAFRDWIIVNLALNEHLHEKLIENPQHMLSDETKLNIIKETVESLSGQIDLSYDYDDEEGGGTEVFSEDALKLIAAKEEFETGDHRNSNNVLKESIPEKRLSLSEAEIDELVIHFMKYFFGKYWQTWVFLINLGIGSALVFFVMKMVVSMKRKEEKLKNVDEPKDDKDDYCDIEPKNMQDYIFSF